MNACFGGNEKEKASAFADAFLGRSDSRTRAH